MTETPPRATIAARRRDAALLTAAVVLAAAFFLIPLWLSPARPDDFPRAFVTYWSTGGPGFPPSLQQLVDDQFRYHLARVSTALPLLAVLAALAARLRRYRLPLAVLAFAAAVLLIADVQGAVSPFGTLLPNLATGPTGTDVTAALTQVRDELAHGPASPALDVMLEQYVRWHVVKAALVALLAAALIALSVPAWRRHRLLTLLTAAPAAAALVVVAANVSTIADPGPPFLLLLQGSW
ncbi:hypothetical protein [Actinoplanes sp. NPDC049265]|uniref:hypothetical protein n=1 Tax=Actinoplanes sp. NPDC049265 TaxID=3363902 RepID=UPI0037166E79